MLIIIMQLPKKQPMQEGYFAPPLFLQKQEISFQYEKYHPYTRR